MLLTLVLTKVWVRPAVISSSGIKDLLIYCQTNANKRSYANAFSSAADLAGVFGSGPQVAAESIRHGISASRSPLSCLMKYCLSPASTSDTPRAYSVRPYVRALPVCLLTELRG